MGLGEEIGPEGRAKLKREACGCQGWERVGPVWPMRALSKPHGQEAQGDPQCHDPLAWRWGPVVSDLQDGTGEQRHLAAPHVLRRRGGQKSW